MGHQARGSTGTENIDSSDKGRLFLTGKPPAIGADQAKFFRHEIQRISQGDTGIICSRITVC